MRYVGGGNSSIASNSDKLLEARKHRPDYMLLVLSGILVALGLIVMYAISPAVSAVSGESNNYYFTHHLLSFAIGIIGAVIIYKIKISNWKALSYILAVIAVILSVIIVAINGVAFRWLKVSGLSFQPSEMMKLALILWLGFFLAKQKQKSKITSFKDTLRPILVILGVLSLIVVLIQRDLGSMVVLASILVASLFIVGYPMKSFALFLAGLVFSASVAIVSTPYRRQRLETFLNPERDCLNEGYHACQALITVGSGGIFGLGVGNSVQAYGYLPETATDSIYAIIAEKFGFIGSVLVICLIGALIFRLEKIASRTMNWHSRIIIVGIMTWLGVQSLINVGAMLGLLPLKGITLPFVSYGGSSLIFVMLGIGVALRISCYTSQRRHDLENIEEGSGYESATIRRGNRRAYNAPLSNR